MGGWIERLKLLARDRVGQHDGEVGQLSGPKHLGVGGTDRVVGMAIDDDRIP